MPQDAPTTITFEGQEYFLTGRTGTHIATQQKVVEYEGRDDVRGFELRAWRFADGRVYEN